MENLAPRPARFSAMFIAMPLAAAGTGAVLGGTVVSGETKIAGARVTLLAAPDAAENFAAFFANPEKPLASVRSGRDGSFELAAPAAGFRRITVEAEGFLGALLWAPALSPAPVALGPINAAGPAGPPPGARPRGPRHPQGPDQAQAARPVAGRLPRWPVFWTTGADGAATVLVAKDEAARVAAVAPGFAAGGLELAPDQDAAELRLERGAALVVAARDARSLSLPDVAVVGEGARPGGGPQRQGLTRATYVLLRPGQEQLAFRTPPAATPRL